MILHKRKFKGSHQKLLKLINEFSKLVIYKINIQKSTVFHSLVVNGMKMKLEKYLHLQ